MPAPSSIVASPTVAAQLLQLTANLADALMLLDADFRITYANPMALRISQLTEANLNRETLWELYPGVRESSLGQAYFEAIRTRSVQEVRGFYYEPLKTTFDLTIFPMNSGIGVHYRDVTARREAENARDAASAQLTQVLAATTDSIISLDRDFRLVYINPAAEQTLAASGNPLGAILWERFPHTVYPGSPFVENYNRSMNERLVTNFQSFYPDPFNFWLDITVYPSAEGIIIFFRDITQQRLRDDDLRASEARYRVLAELSPQSLWSASPEGLVLYANQRFLTYIGKDFVPTTGLEYIACFDPEDQARVIEVWTHSVLTGTDYAVDARLIRASDGASRWWHLRALPVRNAAGNIEQWLGSGVDIHDERLTQQQLLDQLQQQQRAEAALIQSEKLAAVGRLASSIAHEINNPLEAVMNLLYLARGNAETPETRQYLDLADQELRRVSIITNQTLRFHKQSTSPVEITCSALFDSVFTLYEGRLRNSNVQVLLRKRALTPIRCLEGDMRQVVSNLVGNAIDAMSRGGTLFARSRESTHWPTGRKGITLTLADTGSGIPEDSRRHIFDAFFTTKGHAGTGLGLWVSCEIVKRHQGELKVSSSQRPGHSGTVFTVFIPNDFTLQPDSETGLAATAL